MTVYVLTADTVIDASGELMCSGHVVGVYATYDLAESTMLALSESGRRREWEYSIDVFAIET